MNSVAILCSSRYALPLLASLILSACASFDADRQNATLTSKAVVSAQNKSVASESSPETGPLAARADEDETEITEADPEDSLPEVELNPQLLFQLLASEIAAQRGQLGSAAATYLRMAEETRDPRLARRATELALANRTLDRALPAASLWYELAPDSGQATRTYETLLLSTGQLDEAEPIMASRLAQARQDEDLDRFYSQIARSLSRVTDKAAALSLLERLAVRDTDLTAARLALAATASAAGDSDRAVREARAAARLAPDDEITAIRAARLAGEGADGPGPALDILQDFLQRKPTAIEARFAYARLLAGDGRKQEAREQFELALQQEPESPAILFSLAQLAYQTDQKPLAIDYLERFVKLPDTVQRDNDPAWLFLGQIAEELKQYDAAARYYGEVGPGEQYLDARIRLAIVSAHRGEIEQGRKLLRSTTVGSPRERNRLTSAEAEILRIAERNQEAFELLAGAVEKQPEDPDLLYDLAMAAERIDKFDVLEKSLRKVIEINPDSAHAYNALGYTMADRNIRLDEARSLIEKSLELSPDDAHILDSMGWVLYRQGDLEGAEKYLRQAYEKAPEAEVSAHLGEVLYFLGRREEARELWVKARELDPGNKILESTLARLNVDL